MKYSIYNTYLHPSDNDTLLYNAYTGQFVAVRNLLLDNTSHTIEELQTNHPLLYNNLKQAGMILDKDIDEVQNLLNRIHSQENNKDNYILHINPTLDCNFRCWYCYESHLQDSIMSQETLKMTKKFIVKTIETNKLKDFDLGFFGGEPFLCFTSIIEDLIVFTDKKCKENGIRFHVHFTTNGSLLNTTILQFLSKYDCGFQITLDGGEQDHNKTRFFKGGEESYRNILANIIELCALGMRVVIRVNYTSENLSTIPGILEDFKKIDGESKSNISFDFQRVWQDKTSRIDETEENIEKLRELFRNFGFKVSSSNIPQYVLNTCYGDKVNHCLINYNGDVFGCTARNFTKDNRIGVLKQDGSIEYDQEKVSLRETYKLSNESCRNCRIAPLCGGGCKQRAFEQKNNLDCPIGFSSENFDDIVSNIFIYQNNIR